MTQEEALLLQQQAALQKQELHRQQQAELQRQKNQVMANAFVQPQQRFGNIDTQAPNLRSGLLADDAYATAVSQDVGNIDINPYLTKLNLDYKELDNEYSAYQGLYRNVNRLNVDEDIVNKELEKYKIGDNITKNRFALNEVRSKASKFRQDLDSNRSAIGAAQNAYKARAAAEADLMAAVEKGDLNINTAKKLLKEYDLNYDESGGVLGLDEQGNRRTEASDNLYNTYNYGKYAKYVDTDEIINKALQGINYQGTSYSVADATPTYDANGGAWVRATSASGQEEYIPYAEVEDIINTTLKNNPLYQDWTNQDAMLQSRDVNSAQIAYQLGNDARQEAMLIAQRAGLQIDDKGNIVNASNSTASLSGREAAYRYSQLMQQADALEGATSNYTKLIEEGYSEEQAAELAGLPQMNRQQKQVFLKSLTDKQAVRKGTNKTAFSRTKSDKDVSLKFENIAAAGLAKAELDQYNQQQTVAFLANNPDMIEAQPVPDLVNPSIFGNNSGVPTNFVSYLEKQGVKKVGNKLLEEAIAEGSGDGGKSYSNQELNRLYQDYKAMNLETDPESRVKYYINTKEAKDTFGNGTLDDIYNSLKSSGLKGKELAQQFQVKSNELLQSMQTRKVGVTSYLGSPLQDSAEKFYLGDGNRIGLAFQQGNNFYADKGLTSKPLSLKEQAEAVGYEFANDEEFEKFKKNVSFTGTTDGSGIGSGGYAISFIAKDNSDSYQKGQTVTLFSDATTEERAAYHANLHNATEGLFNPKINKSNVIIERTADGKQKAFYNTFHNVWKTVDKEGNTKLSYAPLNSSSSFLTRVSEENEIASGTELEKMKKQNGEIDYSKLSEKTKDSYVKKGILQKEDMQKLYTQNPNYDPKNPKGDAFVVLGDFLNSATGYTTTTKLLDPYRNPGSAQGNIYGEHKVSYPKKIK